MSERIGLKTTEPRHAAGRPPRRRRRWLRWIAIAAAAIVVLFVLAAWAFVKFGPTAVPLALPAGPVSGPAGPLDGSWTVAPGSIAGFRVRETALGMSNDAVGRTSAVAGAVAISGDRVTSATVRVDLAAITVSGKRQPQFASSLRTGQYPDATFTLAAPVALSPAFAAGGTASLRVTGQLAMNGTTHQVTVSISARRDGTTMQVAGSIPVTFSAWHITGPGGFGFLASLADHGTAEFLLTLRQP
jgi:polyisoprenoid-binding protein YceI